MVEQISFKTQDPQHRSHCLLSCFSRDHSMCTIVQLTELGEPWLSVVSVGMAAQLCLGPSWRSSLCSAFCHRTGTNPILTFYRVFISLHACEKEGCPDPNQAMRNQGVTGVAQIPRGPANGGTGSLRIECCGSGYTQWSGWIPPYHHRSLRELGLRDRLMLGNSGAHF